MCKPGFISSFLPLLFVFAVTAQGQTIPPINSVTLKPATVLPAIGPVVDPVNIPGPAVPANLRTPASNENFRLWIYDPRNSSAGLRSPGIFFKSTTSSSWTFVAAASDSSLHMQLDAGTWEFDVLEPTADAGVLARRRYKATVTSGGTVSIDGKAADSRGYFPVAPNIVSTLATERLASLTALANEPASTFQPSSQCQLLDQVTPTRSMGTGLSAGFPRVRIRLPAHGRIRALIVPLDFPDVPGTDDPVAFFTPLAHGMRDFFYAQSYGRLAFDFDILPTWTRMTFNASAYNQGATTGADHTGYRRAVVDLTDPLIDYSLYDAVYFLVPRQMPMTAMRSGPAITSPITTDNGYITNGATAGGDMFLSQNGPSAMRNWMAHETGHAFGLYDEDLDHASATLGSWSLMADSWTSAAIELGGWDRYLLGWLSATQVACLPRQSLPTGGVTVKLDPLVRQNENIKTALVPLSASKVLVVESRKNGGFDSLAANREGVLVYTVDMTIGQLKGGYRIQPRTGSTDTRKFLDAALGAGDSVIVEGVAVSVISTAADGDTVLIRPPAVARTQVTPLSGLKWTAPGQPYSSTAATFVLGFSDASGSSLVTSAAVADTTEIVGYITPPAPHLGTKADIFVVLRVGNTFTMKNQDGIFIPWNTRVPDLVPYREDVTLSDKLEVRIFSGKLGGAGEYRVFLGYMLPDGSLHFTPSAQVLTITP